ncbi:MAG: HK97 family phage prohead protease [Afipia birgiae]|nr:HK97 family phage prohead protease [Afipia birgiae]
MSSTSRVSLASDGTVEGYASLFGEVDQARDMVMPGAFTRTLAQRGLRKIPMLFQHDPAEPVGIWLDLREDFRGLWARGRLIPDVARGRELLALVSEGAIDGLSIGYRTVRGQIDPKTRIRKLYQVDLWEISIVTFPLLAGARVRAVKERVLRKSGHRFCDQSTRSFDSLQTPKLSLLRTRAEREWQGLSSAADAPAPLARRGSPALTRLDTRAGRKHALCGVASPGTEAR